MVDDKELKFTCPKCGHTVKVDEGIEIQEIISKLDYDFIDSTGLAIIEDTEIIDHEVKDSK